jgi:trehalose 6-phosphate phosphatase
MADAIHAPPLSLLEGAALFLDFDGTLVELAETPDAIQVSPALAPLLNRLAVRLDGRLAIVSGRSIADLERHLFCAGIALSGSHGLEIRLRDGTDARLAAAPALDHAREMITNFAGAVPGLLVERKPFGVAIHYRQAPDRAAEVGSFMAELAASTGLTVQHGKMVAELRPLGADKGDAIRVLIAEPDFAGARPVFVGDDLTDEDAFRTAAELGGAGILVGPPRPTAAQWRLGDVREVVTFLEQAAG